MATVTIHQRRARTDAAQFPEPHCFESGNRWPAQWLRTINRHVSRLQVALAIAVTASIGVVSLVAMPATASASSSGNTNQGSTSTTGSSGSNVTTKVLADRDEIVELEKLVRNWKVSCQTISQIELELAYVRDALNQGNILGARSLLQAWSDEASTQANVGLLTQGQASALATHISKVLTSIPTSGTFTDEFHPSTKVPAPIPQSCSAVEVGGAFAQTKSVSFTTSMSMEDLNNLARILAQEAVSHVPGVGFVLSGLLELLWPGSQNDAVTWEEMSNYVDAKIGETIDQQTREHLNNLLEGLSRVLHNYEVALQSPTHIDYIREQFGDSLNALVKDEPSFRPDTRPYLVLPEYVQITNFLVAQLRDGIVYGAGWNIPPTAIADYQNQLNTDISDGTAYVTAQMAASHEAMAKPPNGNPAEKEHYNVNLFSYNANLDLALVPATSDQSFYWPYMNPATYPGPVDPKNTRILFSPAYGYMPSAGTPTVSTTPRDIITNLVVWGYDRLDAMQVTYGLGSSPDSKMGGGGGKNTPPEGGTFPMGPATNTRGVITRVYGYGGDVSEQLGFIFTKDGVTSDTGYMADHRNLRRQNFNISFPDEILGYVKIMGVFPSPYNSASTTVYGFRLDDSY